MEHTDKLIIGAWRNRSLALWGAMLLVGMLSVAWCSPAESSVYACGQLPCRHRARAESWSVFFRGVSDGGDTAFLALYFVSGRVLVLRGHFVEAISYSPLTDDYRYDLDMVMRSKGSAKHRGEALDRQLGGNRLWCDTARHAIRVRTATACGVRDGLITLQNDPIPFATVFRKKMRRAKFDWYLFPRTKVRFRLAEGGDMYEGEGHLQHWWGRKTGHFGDWIAGHTASGYDFFVASFPDHNEDKSWLPGSYLLLRTPDGEVVRLSGFSYDVERLWHDREASETYPVQMRIRLPERDLDLRVRAFKDNQVVATKIARTWAGFSSVEGTIDGEPVTGWAFASPLAR